MICQKCNHTILATKGTCKGGVMTTKGSANVIHHRKEIIDWWWLSLAIVARHVDVIAHIESVDRICDKLIYFVSHNIAHFEALQLNHQNRRQTPKR